MLPLSGTISRPVLLEIINPAETCRRAGKSF